MQTIKGYVDIHSHFLYGVDDGAKTPDQMQKMLDAAQRDGITRLVATPHVTPGIDPFHPSIWKMRLNEAEQYCLRKRYSLALSLGAEILYTPSAEYYLAEKPLPTYDCSDYILMEFVPDVAFEEMDKALALATRRGYSVVLAHVERYACLYWGKRFYQLKDRYDVQYQMNCGTLIDGRGFWRNYRFHKWLKDHMIDYLASDAHDTQRRPFRMKEAYIILENQYGEKYARQLTAAVCPFLTE